MIYLLTIILTIYGIYKYDYCSEQRNKKILWVLLCVILICIAGFRYRLGGDTIQYAKYFQTIPDLFNLRKGDFEITRYGPGFVLFAATCKTILNEFWFLQLSVSFILNLVIFNFFWKNTTHPFFALLLYLFFLYFTLNTETLRESLAVSLFLISWPFYKKGKWLGYYLIIIPSIFFHLSAIILFLLPIITLKGFNYFFTFGKRTIVISIIIILIGYLIRYQFFDLINKLAFNESLVEISLRYSKSKLGGKASLNVFGIISVIFRFVLYPIIAMYCLNKSSGWKYNDSGLAKIEQLSIVSIYFSFISVSILILARYNNYFLFFSIILISDWIFSIIKVNYKWVRLQIGTWIIIILPLFFSCIYSYYIRPINANGQLKVYMIYYPYNNVFSQEKDPNREKIFQYVRRHE